MKGKGKIVAMLMSAVVAVSGASFALVGCGRNTDSTLNRPTDNTKTQLNVFTFGDGDFGTTWLQKARDRFETEYANESFEEGKVGVQINIDLQKISGSDLQSRIPNSTDDMFFGERLFYNDYVKAGLCLDITDIVAEQKLPGEQKTIKDKMTAEQYAFFEQSDGKVYGVPHYSGGAGIVYNIDFFDDNGLYFKNNWKSTPNSPFTGKNGNLSVGPDNTADTDDDGLPATYEEFYILCDYIADEITGAKPLLWNGVVYDEYITDLMFGLMTDYEGADQFNTMYTMDGGLTHVVESVESDGSLKLKSSNVKPSQNGNEIYATAGKYYATQFVSTIFANKDWYDATNVFSSTYSHLEAQKNFLLTEEFGGYTDYAMLIDGNWWEIECSGTINKMVQSMGESASKYNRNFGWMPLPRPDYSSQKRTMVDDMLSCAFIKSNIAESKIRAAKTFLQFVNTDASLIEYTETTNVPKALLYTMSDKSKLSNFGRSYMTMKENSDVVYAYSGSDVYRNNAAAFGATAFFQTSVGGTTYANPIEPLRKGISVKDIFEGYKTAGNALYKGLTL